MNIYIVNVEFMWFCRLYQLTWLTQMGFIYDIHNLSKVRASCFNFMCKSISSVYMRSLCINTFYIGLPIFWQDPLTQHKVKLVGIWVKRAQVINKLTRLTWLTNRAKWVKYTKRLYNLFIKTIYFFKIIKYINNKVY